MVSLRNAIVLIVAVWQISIAQKSSGREVGEVELLDFSTPACTPCLEMRPTIHQLKSRGYPVREVDASQNQEMAAHFHVTRFPTFIVVVNGREFERLVGPTSYTRLERMLHNAGFRAGIPGNSSQPTGLDNPFSNASGTNTVPGTNRVPSPPPATNLPSPESGQSVVSHVLESTVRITIEDPDGNSTGSGTVIDAREGEALVLTCGHLFRSSRGQGEITVTLFNATPQGAQIRSTRRGRLVDFDLERDLGLVSFRADQQVQVAPIASSNPKLSPGDRVTTIGCNHGDLPTAMHTQVTNLNRYLGHANVEASGAPVEGRSGGGMFDAQGQLVGVCFAADPQANEGLYAAISSIHAKLDQLGLTWIYHTSSPGNPMPAPESNPNNPSALPLAQLESSSPGPTRRPAVAIRGQGNMPPTTPRHPIFGDQVSRRDPLTNGHSSLTPTPPQEYQNVGRNAQALGPSEQALMEEIIRRGSTSEIICIIRPHTPDGKSEVITLQKGSPNLVRALVDPAGVSNPFQGSQPAVAASPSGMNRR